MTSASPGAGVSPNSASQTGGCRNMLLLDGRAHGDGKLTMRYVFNAPPNWPPPPSRGWRPPPGWQPPADWGPLPAGWQLWVPVKRDDAWWFTRIYLAAFGLWGLIAVAVAQPSVGRTVGSVAGNGDPAAVGNEIGTRIGEWLTSWQGLVTAAVIFAPIVTVQLIRIAMRRRASA